MPGLSALLHVLNGDCTRAVLERSSVGGTLAVWADVLCEGPVLDGLPAAERRAARARYLASAGLATFEEAVAGLAAWDGALDRFRAYDEVVLWLEHDLFDQLLLIRHLAWFAERDVGATRLSVICIGAFPGIEDFRGLGQLTPAQLASLLDTRRPVSPPEIDLASRAWRAFTASDPLALQAVVAGDTSALPYLAGAIRRLLQEYPAIGDGLSRSERQLLETVACGPCTARDAFVACAAREERVFMGDASFWRIVRELAAPPVPLLSIEPEASVPDGSLRLTAAGRRVLDGDADRVALIGLDRWIGGVHLLGTSIRWRWSETSGQLVNALT